ncbi:toxin-antitoxin system HicB family antitoxin [Nonomuraea sp. NPDC050556]|uniref:toxin-antitoxin system HicB family antitoxin n=1 Tax=Nonomuraea sp. NPDC050556 TaxID=3364369 RepID=UPI00378A1822
MELTTYIESLRRELTSAAEVAGADAGVAAERLVSALDSAVRLTLIEVLSDAADELSREIDPGVVEVRIRGREPEFVVNMPLRHRSGPPGPGFPPAPPRPPEPPTPPGEESTARMTLRLPETLKSRVEEAASSSGVSVNAWLVRALSAAVSGDGGEDAYEPHEPPRRPPIGQRLSGWVR